MGKQVGNVALMQKMNRLKVLNLVRKQTDISRPCIAEQTGLALSSVTNITSYLLEQGLLAENGTNQASGAGRRSTRLRFKEEAYGLIIAAFNEKQARISYTDLGGRILDSIQTQINAGTPEQMIALLENKIGILLERYGKERILAVGVIFSGLVLRGSHFVLSASMKWKESDIKSLLEEATGLPVFVENISRPKAVWYASSVEAQEMDDILFVDLENGIGSVQLKDGVINQSLLGEIGHTTVARDGELCFCGNRGCLEAMCSPKRLKKLYEERSEAEAVAECAGYLGLGLANLIMLTHPRVLVVNNKDYVDSPMFIKMALDECRSRAYPVLTGNLEIIQVNVSEEEAVKGAAIEMCDWLFALSSDHNPVR